ncbi:MAG TPA: glycosyltransferase family A protein [Bryobacteraceae bacterium]
MTPAVSIGVPVYNGSSFLAQALESVCSQTFHDCEIIISDNASRDDTAAICRSFANRDRRVRYVRQPYTIPPAENHNFVAREARGKYFKWATYDDMCAPLFLERCVEVLERDPSVVLCFPKAAVVDASGAILQHYEFPLATDSRRAAERFGSIIRADHRRYGAFEIYGVIRRDALDRIPAMGNYVSGDRVLLTRLVLRGRFQQVPDRLFLSREHSTRSVRTVPEGTRQRRRWLRRVLGVGPLPPLEWWDPSKKGAINFPEWRLIREYAASIRSAPICAVERVQCGAELLRWLFGDAPKLTRDVLLAIEQLASGVPPRRRFSQT